MRISDWRSDVCSSDLLQLGAQVRIVRVADETAAERQQRLLDADPQAVAGGLALLAARLAPAFQGAVGGCGTGIAEAAGVAQKPERRDISDGLAPDQAPHVGPDMGRAGQGGTFARQAPRPATGRDAAGERWGERRD